MWKTIGMLTMLALALGSPAPARAEDKTGERVLGTLSDLLLGNQKISGYVVAVRDSDVVVRGTDSRTYDVSRTGIDGQQLARLQPGQPVKMTVKRGNGDALVVSSFETDNGQPRSFRTVNGVVESVSGSRVQFRTSEGFVVPLDLNRLVGPKPALQRGESASLIYEQVDQNPITAVWIDTRPSLGAASPRTTAPSDSAFQRVHGYVQSIGVGTLTLKADDGRTMTVDVSNAQGAANGIRPGDLVDVIGRSTADRFIAEAVRRD